MQPRTKEYYYAHNKQRYDHGVAKDYLCEGGCQGQAQEWANVHGTNKYVPLCIPCHKQYDFGICPHGHDTLKFGRVPGGGGCRVCHRLDRARREKRTVCRTCGLSYCECGRR